jgi:hypothetical protein
MGKYVWQESDDIVALYLYRYGTKGFGSMSVSLFAICLGIEPASMKMRIDNFKHLDGKGGLPNVAEQTRRIYEQHRNLPEKEHLEMVGRTFAERVPRAKPKDGG